MQPDRADRLEVDGAHASGEVPNVATRWIQFHFAVELICGQPNIKPDEGSVGCDPRLEPNQRIQLGLPQQCAHEPDRLVLRHQHLKTCSSERRWATSTSCRTRRCGLLSLP